MLHRLMLLYACCFLLLLFVIQNFALHVLICSLSVITFLLNRNMFQALTGVSGRFACILDLALLTMRQ